jgi:hypothetical protein
LRVGGGSGESEAASYGRLHEKDARKKLEQILGLQIAEAKKVVDKGRRMELKKGSALNKRSQDEEQRRCGLLSSLIKNKIKFSST